jgi:aspartate carbamoyltransferase catalytic subunit
VRNGVYVRMAVLKLLLLDCKEYGDASSDV